jgi:hypothetical protein
VLAFFDLPGTSNGGDQWTARAPTRFRPRLPQPEGLYVQWCNSDLGGTSWTYRLRRVRRWPRWRSRTR